MRQIRLFTWVVIFLWLPAMPSDAGYAPPAMSPEAMQGMTADEIANMPPDAMQGMDVDMMGNMPPEATYQAGFKAGAADCCSTNNLIQCGTDALKTAYREKKQC